MYTDCYINNKVISCLIDTGSACSILKDNLVFSLCDKVEPHCSILRGIGSGTIQTTGKVKALIRNNDVEMELLFFVV